LSGAASCERCLCLVDLFSRFLNNPTWKYIGRFLKTYNFNE
jgi:hypothetical protein